MTDSCEEKKWTLIWSDEFDYRGLPNPEKWDYEVGFVRNNEKQYYTKARLENCFVKDGLLTIRAIKEQYPNRDYNNQTLTVKESEKWKTVDRYASYTSASVNTKGKADWKYGKIEIRAKLPRGKGMWPAIWMMGMDIDQVGWPKCGEIDIMEFIGSDGTFISSGFHYLSPQTGQHAAYQKMTKIIDPCSDFHIFTLEWDATSMIVKYDGMAFNRFRTNIAGGIFDKANYLLLNLATGGNWGGKIDDSALPADFQIDYVRVYKGDPVKKYRDGLKIHQEENY